MASIRLYERLLFCLYPDTMGQRKRLQPCLAFVPCVLLPLLVFRLHTLKSRLHIRPERKQHIPANKRYTSPQRPFTHSWYTDTANGQKRDTGRLWGCHGIPAHCSTPELRRPATLKRSGHTASTCLGFAFLIDTFTFSPKNRRFQPLPYSIFHSFFVNFSA